MMNYDCKVTAKAGATLGCESQIIEQQGRSNGVSLSGVSCQLRLSLPGFGQGGFHETWTLQIMSETYQIYYSSSTIERGLS
jgi:hypothetical protein